MNLCIHLAPNLRFWYNRQNKVGGKYKNVLCSINSINCNRSTQQQLQNAVLTDETGSIKMIVWGKLILKSEEDVPIILQNVKVNHCYAVSITTLSTTTIPSSEDIINTRKNNFVLCICWFINVELLLIDMEKDEYQDAMVFDATLVNIIKIDLSMSEKKIEDKLMNNLQKHDLS